MCDKHALKKFRTLAFEANSGIMLETQEKVHEFLNENEFVLNVDKTELIFFEERNTLEKIEKKQFPQRNMPGILE